MTFLWTSYFYQKITFPMNCQVFWCYSRYCVFHDIKKSLHSLNEWKNIWHFLSSIKLWSVMEKACIWDLRFLLKWKMIWSLPCFEMCMCFEFGISFEENYMNLSNWDFMQYAFLAFGNWFVIKWFKPSLNECLKIVHCFAALKKWLYNVKLNDWIILK